MTVQSNTNLNFSTGPISFSELRRIFIENTSIPVSLSNLYRDIDPNTPDPVVPDATENQDIPTSGTFSTGTFRDSLKALTLEQTGTDLNLKIQDYINLYGSTNFTKNIRKNFNIKGTVASNSTSTSALDYTTTVSIKNFAIVNDGNIYGAGGTGGTSTALPSSGGDAINLGTYVKVVNNGNIWAGGGGGGRGGTGGTGGTGGQGQYSSFISQQCSQFVPKTCTSFVPKTCTQFTPKTCTSFVPKTCTTPVTTTKDYGSAAGYGGVTSCDQACQLLANSGSSCTGKCTAAFIYQANGKMQGGYTSYQCAKCTKQVTTQQTYDCSYTSTYDCSTSYSYDCSYTSSYDCGFVTYFDCSYTQVTYTSGGGGGGGGSGGSGGRGRGYNYQSPNSLSGSSGSSGNTGGSGGVNAGSGGTGGTGGTGGSGGDWGQDGSTGLTGDTGNAGSPGNYTGGAAGSGGSGGTNGASSGNYIKGITNANLINNNSVKGRTA